eukprot:TRINITY_DN44635_c0_g1_i1.p1 TRINITY_DN44635_c0_g1~~TRINITY_DN44635_c0_g1_i1.p1  ORF type:complete len:534 (+),score=101.89 TRINITY_DN44635_c0_g1_i1:122-1603(+)
MAAAVGNDDAYRSRRHGAALALGALLALPLSRCAAPPPRRAQTGEAQLSQLSQLSEDEIGAALRDSFPALLGLPPWGYAGAQEAADAARAQRLFSASQNPDSCSPDSVRFMINDAHPYGFGSQLLGLTGVFLEAVALGMVMVSVPVGRAVGSTVDARGRLNPAQRVAFVSPSRCPEGTWQCIYMPFGKCDGARSLARGMPSQCRCPHARPGGPCPARGARCRHILRISHEPWGGLASLEVKGAPDLSAALARRAGLSRPRGVLFWVAEALRYITRPNRELRDLTLRVRDSIGLADVDLSRAIGVHIRHGTSATETGLTSLRNYYDVDQFAQAVEAIAFSMDGPTHCFFGTDNVRNEQAFSVALERAGGKPGLPSLRPAFINSSWFATGKTGGKWDEAMLLSVQLYLLGGCGAFVGSFEFNTALLAVPMMAAARPGRVPLYFDLGGSAWHMGEPWLPRGHPRWARPFHGLMHREQMHQFRLQREKEQWVKQSKR